MELVSVKKRGHKFRQNRGGVCFSDHGSYFHFMPVGNNAVPELMPTPEQRWCMQPEHTRPAYENYTEEKRLHPELAAFEKAEVK